MNQLAVSPSLLCPCGSGLRHSMCCAMTRVEAVAPEQAQRQAPRLEQVRAAQSDGDTVRAERLCLDMLEQRPGLVPALRLLYEIKSAAGVKPAAEALLKRLVKLRPNDGDLACELAMLLYQRRNMSEAELHARNGIRLKPLYAQAHNMLGMILTDQNRLLAGEYHYRRALELHKPVGKLCANLGLNLKNQGKLDESERYYREALSLEPDNVATLLGWVKLEEARRNFDHAWELLARAEKINPESAEIAVCRATLHARAKEHDQALAELDRLEQSSAAGALGPGYYMERGRVLDKLGRYDEAFAAYDRANEQIRDSGRGTYSPERPRQLTDRLKNFFTRTRLEILPRATVRSDVAQPLFIVGFPRSGTTMMEQILTAHPLICAGDELTFMGDLTRIGPKLLNSPLHYPECFSDLWMGDNLEALDNFRDFYLKKTQQLGIITPGSAWFTDKMPLNEMHLGMISLVFPQSPIIHLLRHPLDVVLSSFFTDMTHGFNCSYTLKSAATHYMLMQELVDHYREQLDMRYLTVRYEDVVGDQENQVRRLLEFIGVPWDERCLEFHNNTRFARTASYAQVTEKLYTSSRYRYRNYRKQLDAIVPILLPAIERLGYKVE